MATGSKNDLQKRPSSLKISDSNNAVESGDEEENHSLSCQVNNHHKDMNPMILSTFYTICLRSRPVTPDVVRQSVRGCPYIT